MGKQAPAYPAAPDSESVIKERQMNGCGNAIQFFEGVEVKETFEKNW